jgi:hypothetical protein
MFLTHNKPDWHTVWLRYELGDWAPATREAAARAATRAATQPATTRAATAGGAATTRARASLTTTTAGDAATKPAGPKDVVEAIAKCAADLRSPSTSDADKAIAICWLGHLIGDIHQPMHAANLYSARFPRGDNVGSRFLVLRTGIQRHLHAVWDEMLGVQYSPRTVDFIADGIRANPAWQRAALGKDIAVQDPMAWARESHDLARRVVYLDGTLPGTNLEDHRLDPTLAVPSLTDDYLRASEELAQRQAALAGYRLADLLNEVLGE